MSRHVAVFSSKPTQKCHYRENKLKQVINAMFSNYYRNKTNKGLQKIEVGVKTKVLGTVDTYCLGELVIP